MRRRRHARRVHDAAGAVRELRGVHGDRVGGLRLHVWGCGAELGVSYPEEGTYSALCADCGGDSLVAVFVGEPEGGYFTADTERVN